MKKTGTRALSWLLALTMMIALLPAAAFAEADAPAEAVAAEFLSWNKEAMTLEFQGVEGQEYALVELNDGTLDWSKAVTPAADGSLSFSDIDYATAYSLYTRVAGAEDGIAAVTQCSTGLESVKVVVGEEGCVQMGTISAEVSPADADVYYQWCCDTVTDDGEGGVRHTYEPIPGGDRASYTIFDPAGTMLAVQIYSSDYALLETVDGIGPVVAQPFWLSDVGPDSIRFSGVEGQEYTVVKKDAAPDWSEVFLPDEEEMVSVTGLSPATRYDLYTRAAGTDSVGVKYTFSTDLKEGITLVDEPEELTAGTVLRVTSDPVVDYQWYRNEQVDSGDGWASYMMREIPGAVGDTYTVTAYDVGYEIEVGALLEDDLLDSASAGTVWSEEGAPVIQSLDPTQAEILAEEGREYALAKKDGSPDWSAAKTYDGEDSLFFDGLTPGGQYVIFSRAFGASGDGVSTAFAAPLNRVSVDCEDDSLIEGSVLTVRTDPEGDYNYQWMRIYEDSAPMSIPGATGKTYTVTRNDIGYGIGVTVYADTAKVGVGHADGQVKTPAAPAAAPRIVALEAESVMVKGELYQEYLVVEKGVVPDEEMWESANRDWMTDGDVVFFDGLTPGTAYEVWTRAMAISYRLAGEPAKTGFVTCAYGLALTSPDTLVGCTLEAQSDPEDISGARWQWCEQVVTVYRSADGDIYTRYDFFPLEGEEQSTLLLTPELEGKTLAVRLLKEGEELASAQDIGPVVAYALVEFDSDRGSEVEPQTDIPYGGKVTRPADPVRSGYTFEGWYVDDETPWDFDNDTVTCAYLCLMAKWSSGGGSGYYIPSKPAASQPSGETQPQVQTDLPFVDVAEDAWYRDAVALCYENGWLLGTAEDRFSPDAAMTRGMFASLLYRMAGQPSVSGESPFSDAETGKWYSDAVLWAAREGIALGRGDGTFGVNDPVTREQIAVLLFRYARYAGMDVSAGEDTNILSYDDAFDVSEWAIPAMQWAVGSGVMSGRTESALAPLAQANRAEAARLIANFAALAD